VTPDILSRVDPQLVADAEFNLLFGYVDDELLSIDFWRAVHYRLLERYTSIYVLALQDLVVRDGQRVTFSNTTTAFFNTVTIYGSGSLDFRGDCKLIADRVERVVLPAVPGGGTGHIPGGE
jgi:hypothetical protein